MQIDKIIYMTSKLSNSYLTATFNHKGAELCELNSATRNYIWNGDVKHWGKHSPLLFPIVGTLRDNVYTYQDKKYTLPRHGFARDLDFEVVAQSDNEITFSLQSNELTKANYPFEFELKIIYTLIGNDLKVKYEVINKNNFQMPFSIGAHPAFSLPLDFTHYSLLFDTNTDLKFHLLVNDLVDSETSLPLANGKLHLDYSIFDNDALVFKTKPSSSITILEQNRSIIKISFNDFPNLGIWSKPNAPFICLEPWFGYADIVNSNGNIFKKEGVQILNAFGIFTSEYGISIF